ncbi:MAG: iron ABC transporter substrate-binding protein, partial [Pseudomonadota bacterium]
MKLAMTTMMLSLMASTAFAQVTVQSCDREVTFDAPPQAAISNDVNLTEMM